jgi:DNA-binding transcriptional regulator YhcF (GntR family)
LVENRSPAIAEVLRTRVLRGLRGGTLRSGERLPSARDLVTEFGVDHRLILAAYRQLANDGLIEIRERGGVYVAAAAATEATAATLPTRWFVDTLTEAYAYEMPAPQLHEWMRRAIETLRLRAIVVSTTADQVGGLARELRDDFGLEADGITGDELASASTSSLAARRADVIIATTGQAEVAERVAGQLKKPVIIIALRPDLVVGEWALLLRRPVWAIVATPEFGDMLRRFFAKVPGIENLHVLVHGRDDLSVIPDGAPTYVTHRVREALGDTPIRGRILAAARTIASDSARTIFEFIVRTNLAAMAAVQATQADVRRTPPTS